MITSEIIKVMHHVHDLQLITLLVGFSVSLISTWVLCHLTKVMSIGRDRSEGIQKFHVNPTSRLGGISIFLGLLVSGVVQSIFLYTGNSGCVPLELFPCFVLKGKNNIVSDLGTHTFWFLLASLPVWLAGLVEDLTHKVGPTLRLVMATLSAVWLYSALGVGVNRTDVWPVDLLLNIPGAPLCITLLVVTGFTHSVNIVDGFHGLAGGLVLSSLCGLTYLSWEFGDSLVMQMSLTTFSVVLGFFVFNWPKGSIFLGDAGAYLIGFWVVELGILLSMRNPEISPMTPVVVALLPLIETLFSMYRRNIVRNHPVNQPDALHLHTLVYRRLIFNPSVSYSPDQLNSTNAKVAKFFWTPAILFIVLACAFAESTMVQLVLMMLYLGMYNWLYLQLVRFKAPFFLKFR